MLEFFIILLLSSLQSLFPNNIYNSYIGKKLYNNYNCESTLFLYPYGRFDEYDCEMQSYYYGHYWISRDTLFLETFCGDYCHEDSNCFAFGKDAYVLEKDSLLRVRLWNGWSRGYTERKIEHRICWGLR